MTCETRNWTTNFLNGNLTTTAWTAPYFRPNSSLGGKTPIEFVSENSNKALFRDKVEALYDETEERIREQAYWRDLPMAKFPSLSRNCSLSNFSKQSTRAKRFPDQGFRFDWEEYTSPSPSCEHLLIGAIIFPNGGVLPENASLTCGASLLLKSLSDLIECVRLSILYEQS